METKARSAQTEPIDAASVQAKLGTAASRDVASQIARNSVTLLRNDANKAPLNAAKGTRVLVAGSSWANPELLPEPLKAAGFSVVFTQDPDAKENPSDSEISAWVRQAANVDTVILLATPLAPSSSKPLTRWWPPVSR